MLNTQSKASALVDLKEVKEPRLGFSGYLECPLWARPTVALIGATHHPAHLGETSSTKWTYGHNATIAVIQSTNHMTSVEEPHPYTDKTIRHERLEKRDWSLTVMSGTLNETSSWMVARSLQKTFIKKEHEWLPEAEYKWLKSDGIKFILGCDGGGINAGAGLGSLVESNNEPLWLVFDDEVAFDIRYEMSHELPVFYSSNRPIYAMTVDTSINNSTIFERLGRKSGDIYQNPAATAAEQNQKPIGVWKSQTPPANFQGHVCQWEIMMEYAEGTEGELDFYAKCTPGQSFFTIVATRTQALTYAIDMHRTHKPGTTITQTMVSENEHFIYIRHTDMPLHTDQKT